MENQRIRTIKPELFFHEGLHELEQETGEPVRLAWIGLFTCADREGRFRWQPRKLRAKIFPYEPHVDMGRVLDALATRGLLVKYASPKPDARVAVVPEEHLYGAIVSWKKHQVINNRERASDLPAPEDGALVAPELTSVSRREPHASRTRGRRVKDACPTPLGKVKAEGEGEKEEEENSLRSFSVAPADADAAPADLFSSNSPAALSDTDRADAAATADAAVPPDGMQIVPISIPREPDVTPGTLVWRAYADAYRLRYGVEPSRNAKTASLCKQFSAQLGADAVPVAAFFLTLRDAFYVRGFHPLEIMLRDAQKLRTAYLTGKTITGGEARRIEAWDETDRAVQAVLRGEVGP